MACRFGAHNKTYSQTEKCSKEMDEKQFVGTTEERKWWEICGKIPMLQCVCMRDEGNRNERKRNKWKKKEQHSYMEFA